jgi:hypothetical protein
MGSKPLSWARMHELCASIPRFPSLDTLYLDHDHHGGASSTNVMWRIPWLCLDWGECHYRDWHHDTDPLGSAQLSCTIHEDAETMVQDFLTKALSIQRDSSARSPSSLIRLPWEIIELIAMQLTTKDALSLRLCSSVFLPLLHSHSFGRSRFCGHAERSYYFEGVELQTLPRLISASKSLSKMEMKHTAGVLQIRRVWSLVAQFSDLARLKLASPIHILPAPPDIEMEWFHVSGTICPDKLRLNLPLGCKTLIGCQATLRQEPAKVTVFICLPGKLN